MIHVSKLCILNRVSSPKLDFMIYMSAACCSCCPPGWTDVGKLPLSLGFPLPACIQRWTSITCHNSRMKTRDTADKETEVLNQKDLIHQMKLMGNQLFTLISFFLLDPKLNQIHMQWKAAEKKLWSFWLQAFKYYISKFNSTILKNYGLLLNITETLPNRHCIETSPQYNDCLRLHWVPHTAQALPCGEAMVVMVTVGSGARMPVFTARLHGFLAESAGQVL